MKTLYIKSLMLAGALAPSAFALSLYDTAPPIGLPESHAMQYSVYAKVGYDDNINSTSRDENDAIFTSFGGRASYSDQEATDRISYNVQLGARLYDKAAEGADQHLFSDSAVHAELSHTFSDQSVYTTYVVMSYRVDPDFSNGISAARNQGECFNWAWSNAYSRAIDTRWSWTANCSYSGNTYTKGAYKSDDRQYLNGGAVLTYRESSLTSYNISTSYRYDIRSEGENSDNIYLNGGVNHALSPVSSVNATLGVQCKFIDGNTDLYPNVRLGYNRKMGEGLSVRAYLSLDNENVGIYRNQATYLSDQALRVGSDFSYKLSHKVSFDFGASIINSRYSKHTGGAKDRSETTWTAHVGMNYKFTEHLTGTLQYKYTEASRNAGDYDRSVMSAGVTYNF